MNLLRRIQSLVLLVALIPFSIGLVVGLARSETI